MPKTSGLAWPRVTKSRRPRPTAGATGHERGGAPFWRLVDFREGIDPDARDRVEAALAGAGLLDAWVRRDGTLHIDEGDADSFVVVAPSTSRPSLSPGERLSSVLKPDSAIGPGAPGARFVPASVVSSILESIELADRAAGELTAGHSAAIGRDGSFRLSMLAGMSPNNPASHIGAASRERERRRKIAGLDATIARLAIALAEVEGNLKQTDFALQRALAERELLPTGEELLTAESEVSECAREMATARRRLREAERRRQAAVAELSRAALELDHLASRHRLPKRCELLAKVRAQLTALDEQVRGWSRDCDALRQLDTELARLAKVVEQAIDALEVAIAANDESAAEHGRVCTKLSILDETIGSAFREVQAKLEQAERDLRSSRERLREIGRNMEAGATKVGALEATVASAERKRTEAEAARASCHRQFTVALSDGLARDGALELDGARPDGVTAVLEVARRLAAPLGSVAGTAKAITRAGNAVAEALHRASQELGGRVDLVFEESREGDWSLLRASSQGIRQSVPELVDTLSGELATAENELHDDEKRLFDETLTVTMRSAKKTAYEEDIVAELLDELREGRD